MEYLEGKKVMYNNEECVVVACERGIRFHCHGQREEKISPMF